MTRDEKTQEIRRAIVVEFAATAKGAARLHRLLTSLVDLYRSPDRESPSPSPEGPC